MSETWIPDPASEPIERDMEAMNLPESDRDELRRFAEVLRRKNAKKKGKELPPMPPGMKEWLLGEQ